ncbi:MAG: hypothetical protein CTY15_12795 [Methylocystis sp.]|nr:MAG: hypothetical protein CTY15_12795 [Methylocystis sp.]
MLCANASACFIGCRPSDDHARAVVNNLLASRFNAPYEVLSYKTTRTADFDLIVGEVRGYEIFYKASVRFPEGANLDCAPDAAPRAADCTDDNYFSLIRPTRPTPDQRQFVERGGVRSFDEDLRFAESKGGWKGPDGRFYKP